MASEVIGREQELGELRAALAAVDELPATFLVEGEPGIGKTILWRAGLEQASRNGYRVLGATPSTAETRLSFAALGDLLEPALADTLSELPAPQRRALEVALLLEDSEGLPPDHRAVSLAFLGALRALADAAPVLVAVDDAQWLDGPSALVLEFALRRLREDRVLFLLTRRAEGDPAPLALVRALPEDRLRRLTLGPLSLGALHRLVRERLGLVLARPMLRRLREISGGNPFYALELARAVERGSIRLAAGEPLPASLGALVHERLEGLPAETRAALLAASALSEPTLGLVQDASGDAEGAALTPGLEAQVIEVEDDRIRFAHPLLASGVYGAALIDERRALHLRLAELVPDAEERARHLALGADGPNPDVSAALEDAARRAHARGATPTAAELAEQARRLTPADLDEEIHRRTIQAATYAFEAGDGARASALFEQALPASPAGPRRAEVLAWLGTLEEYHGDLHRGVALFREGLEHAGDDLGLRAQIEDWLGDSLFLMRTELVRALEHARSAVALAQQIGDAPRLVSALSGEALVAAAVGDPSWRTVLDRAEDVERDGNPVPVMVSPAFHRSIILMWLDELDDASALMRSLCERAEELGQESALPFMLANLTLIEQLAGRWEAGAASAGEGIDMAAQTNQEAATLRALGARAVVRASLGDVDGARSDANATLPQSRKRGVMMATMAAASGLGLLELSLEDPESAHRELGPVVEEIEAGGVREPGAARFVFDEVEALAGIGALADAGALLDRWEERARTLDRASALAASARCRGLLAAARGDLEGALASLEEALAEHDRATLPFDRARTLLALGDVQRRAQRRRAARETLEKALREFEALGARIWAARARSELARIGGRRASGDGLTATEERVAELVSQGLTNKAVAERLYVTDRTVEGHLSRIYAKLGIRSRTELASRLAVKS